MPNICAAAAAFMLDMDAISCLSLSKISSRFLICFLSLALRFWNQIFTCKVDYTLSSTRANIVQHVFLILPVRTCLSESSNACANSAFRRMVMYLLKWNSLSNSSLW